MSKSSQIKGRKTAKAYNLRSNKGNRKHIPYGSTKQRGYDGEDDLVGIVNKTKERQTVKRELTKMKRLYSDNIDELIEQI